MKTISKYVFGLASVLALIFGTYSCNSDYVDNIVISTSENTLVFKEAEEMPRLIEDSIIVEYFDFYLSHSKIHSRGLDSLYDFIIESENNLDYLDLKEKIRLFCESENIFIDKGISAEDSPFMKFFMKESRADNIQNLNSLENTIANETPLLLEMLDNVSENINLSENHLRTLFLEEILNERFKNLSAYRTTFYSFKQRCIY